MNEETNNIPSQDPLDNKIQSNGQSDSESDNVKIEQPTNADGLSGLSELERQTGQEDSSTLIEHLQENNRDEIKVEPLFESKDKPLNAGGPGMPTLLTESLTLTIRKLVLEDESYVGIQEKLRIAAGTWDHWVWNDTQGFREMLNNWRRERMVKKAESRIEQHIYSENDRVSLDAATFTVETLKKNIYSKRTEQTGANGEPLSVSVVRYADNNTTLPIRTEKLPSSDSQSV